MGKSDTGRRALQCLTQSELLNYCQYYHYLIIEDIFRKFLKNPVFS